MIQELLTLAEAVSCQVDGTNEQVEYCRRKLALPEQQWNPPPLITGDDLRHAGLQVGPVYSQILESVRDAQLEDRVTTRQAALELARQLYRDAATTDRD